jgi:hypothetical protein
MRRILLGLLILGCQPDGGTNDAGTDGAIDVADVVTTDVLPDGAPSDGPANDAGDGGICSSGGVVVPTNLGGGVSGHAIAQGNNLFFVSQTVEILSVPKSGGSAVTIVSGSDTIIGLAADATSVYFTTPGAVLKCPLAGCGNNPPATVASVQVNPHEIVTDGTNVYYTTDTQILKCSVAGCGSSPTVFASFGSAQVDIALDNTNLYWTNASTGTVASCPLSGCQGQPNVVASALSYPFGVSTDGTQVFWADANTIDIFACPTTGCGTSPTKLAHTSNGLDSPTFTDGKDVYWGDSVQAYRCAVGGCSSMPSIVINDGSNQNPQVFAADSTGFFYASPTTTGALLQCPPCGCNGAAVAVTNQRGVTTDVVTDGTNVYWVDEGVATNGKGPGTLYRCAATDCATTATMVYQALSTLSSLMLSNTHLYFAKNGYQLNGDGVLMRCTTASGCTDAAPMPMYSSADTYTVGGTVAGLGNGASVTLQNGSDQVTVSANGAFTFPTAMSSGGTFVATIASQVNASCKTNGATGTVGYGNVDTIVVNCTANQYTVGGTLTGWLSSAVTLQTGTTSITLRGPGAFAFPPTTGAYSVSVTSAPADVSCTVANGSGTAFADVTNVQVTCQNGQQSGLIADGSYLYWVRDLNPQNGPFVSGAILRLPLGGGAPLLLASNLVGVGAASTALDANNLYFTSWEAGTVSEVPINGGTVKPIATGYTEPSSLVRNGTTLFWLTFDHTYSLDLAADAGTAVIISNNGSSSDPSDHAIPSYLAVTNNSLYWNLGGLGRSTLQGTNMMTISAGTASGGIAFVGGRTFFASTTPSIVSTSQ